MKTIIERGASWTLEETKMLLALWGQDLVQRQATNLKRTKEVYERISEKFNQNGFERTADQVRTRVFNMIAEYRRILKDPNPERMRKCIFFEALHKIYQAKHMDDVKSALDDYEPEYPYSPASNTICSEKGESESISDSEATDGNETVDGASITNSQSTSATSPSNTTTTTTTTSSAAAGANNIATVTNNSGTQSCSTNETLTSNDNNGDSNNNTDKEQQQQSHGSSSSTGATASKKIKLESPKSSGQASSSSTSATPSSSTTSSDHHSSSKQNKSSSTTPSTPLVATTQLCGTSSTATASNNTYSSTTTASSSQRHQSLLLPHATATSSTAGATTSTPISKLATSGGNNTPSYININSTNLPIIRTNQLIGHSATNGNHESINGTKPRLPTTAAITSHQLYQAPVNTFDVTSSALLIDRMFAHLSRESENMREWIALEKERLALERARRQQETEREARRERVLIDTLMKFQEQWLSFLSRLDPRMVQNAGESPPELRVPPKDAASTSSTSASSSQQLVENSQSSNADAGK